MKTLSIIVILCSMALSSFGQLTPQERLQYEQKVKSYNRMKNTGVKVGVFGGLMIPIGGFIFLTGYTTKSGFLRFPDIETMCLGGSIAGVGVGMLITGIILSNKGKRQASECQERFDLDVIYNEDIKGLRLVYRF